MLRAMSASAFVRPPETTTNAYTLGISQNSEHGAVFRQTASSSLLILTH